MAVNNKINNNQQATGLVVQYEANGEQVKLTPAMVKNYLVSGSGNVTDQEVMAFLSLCRYQHINPFLREAYLIKYGSSPATIVTGKDLFLKRAFRNPAFNGLQAGVLVWDGEKIQEREGTVKLLGEDVVGGWARVYVKGYEQPIYCSAAFDEYAGRKADGSLNNQWATKPATMIRKVALVQALREAFPEDFSGLYSQEEMSVPATVQLDEQPVIIDQAEPVKPEPVPAQTVEDALFGGEA